MVCEWGMSEKLGMVHYGEHEDYVFLGRDMGRSRDYSEATAREIDSEVKKFCDDAYIRAREMIVKFRQQLELIAKALLEYETLDGSQVRDILEHGRMLNPPKPLSAATPMPPTPTKDPGKKKDEGLVIAPDYPAGLTEAPAGA